MGDFNSVEDYMQNAESNRNSAILNTLLENEPGMKELPNITDNDIGKYLKVKSDKSLEWAEGGTGGGVLVVHIDNETGALDKTWKEINDADFAVIVSRDDGIREYVSGFLIPSGPVTKYYIFSVASYTTLSSDPKGDVFVNRYVCDTQNDYPVASS